MVLELPHEHRQKSRRARKRVEHPDGAALRESESDEAVRGVVASALRGRSARKFSDDGDECGVENGDEEDEDGHGDDDDEASAPLARSGQQGRACEEEADEHRAAVAHEDRGRVRVVAEEAQESRRERGERGGLDHLPVGGEVRGDEDRRDGRDAGGQPVHVVEEVDGVRDPDEPEDRHDQGDRRAPAPRQHQPEVDDRARDQHLSDQLLVGLDVEEVVQQPDGEERRARAQHHPALPRVRDEQEVGDGDRRVDRDAAQHRRRLAVPAVGLRPGDHAAAARGGAHQRRQRERQRQRHGGGHKVTAAERHGLGSERFSSCAVRSY